MIIMEIKRTYGERKFKISAEDAMKLVDILDRLVEVEYDHRAKGYVLDGDKSEGPVSMVVVPGELVERAPDVEVAKVEEPQCDPT